MPIFPQLKVAFSNELLIRSDFRIGKRTYCTPSYVAGLLGLPESVGEPS